MQELNFFNNFSLNLPTDFELNNYKEINKLFLI